MEYQVPAKNQELVRLVRQGSVRRSFVNLRVVGNNIQVEEDKEFKKQLEQDIAEHFTFMLRISFFNGSFQELRSLVLRYEKQFRDSRASHERLKQVDQLIEKSKKDIIWADKELKEIADYKTSAVQRQDFNQNNTEMAMSLLDKDFMRVKALDTLKQDGARATREAIAKTTKVEAQTYINWLNGQKKQQQQFDGELENIIKKWNSDDKTYKDGVSFVDNMQAQQVSIYNERSWQSGTWKQQFNKQVTTAVPFFKALHSKYLGCLKFDLDMNELLDLVMNKKMIKDLLVEIARREAERPILEAFIKHYEGELRDATHKLQNLVAYDELQKLRACMVVVNQNLVNVDSGFRGLSLTVHTSGGKVTDVDLNKKDVAITQVDPYSVKYTEQTLLQQQIVEQTKQILNQLREERQILEIRKRELEVLLAEPPKVKARYEQKFKEDSKFGQGQAEQITQLLTLMNLQNFDELCFKKDRMPCLIGALSDKLVIKKNGCCMCCSQQKLHEADTLFYKDFEKTIAGEIRRIKKVENKWFTSDSERILQADDLPVVQTTAQILANNYILAALRNNDGTRQVRRGVRNFDVNGSVALTLNELCQLVVVEQQLQMNMKSPLIDEKLRRWQKLYADAQAGQLAQNQIDAQAVQLTQNQIVPINQ